MSPLYLLDPTDRASWFPFGDCRPVSELRAGAWLIRERWEAIAGEPATGIFGLAHLHPFVEPGVPPVSTQQPLDGPVLIGRSDFAPSGVPPDGLGGETVRLSNEGHTVGWWVADGDRWDGPSETGPTAEIEGMTLRGAFDLVTALEHLLPGDVLDFAREGGDGVPDGCVVIGDPAEVVLLGARVEPGVVFDVREGVVVLEQDCYVNSGTRLEGPLYVATQTLIAGGTVGRASIGPRCRVRGDVSSTVFLGFGNKAHDGFVGHSVVGRWVNLGAGTITSNLKNTYGNVRIQVGSATFDTERQFLGSLVGDHAKTAIGTLLQTGTVVGPGANVFDAVRPAKCVPPFAWGVGGEQMDRGGFVRVALRVMERRGIQPSDAVRGMLESLYDFGTRPLA